MMSLQLSAEMVGGIASVASCHDLVGSRLSSGRAARRTLATLVVGTVTAVQFLNSCASSCCRRRRGDVSVPTSSGTRCDKLIAGAPNPAWDDHANWTYSFGASAEVATAHQRLVLDGVKMVADVSLNGEWPEATPRTSSCA